MMANKCLFCYRPVENGKDFHDKCASEFFGSAAAPALPYKLDQMADLAKEIIQQSAAVTGVQPKLSLSLVQDVMQNSKQRFTITGALGSNFIFKPPSPLYPEMPANEHVTMRMAESYGLRVVPSSLIRLQSGELGYITKRIDRKTDGTKIHMMDMFQITEAQDKYRSSLEKISNAVHKYSDNTMLDKIFFFELVLFCFLTGNNDMHLKNFSMIKSISGWTLAPAYDLLNVNIVIPDDNEELALTLEGKKKNLKRKHFDHLAKNLGLTDRQTQGVYKRMIKNKSLATHWIYDSFLTEKMQQAYIEVMDSKYAQLELEYI